MQTYEPNTIVSVFIPFIHQGEAFLPAANSVRYTLRDHAGTPVPGFVDVPLTPGLTDTFVRIEVPALQNAITAGRRFETRTINLRALIGTTPWHTQVRYRLLPWLPITVTPDSIRSYVGLDVTELPDTDLDVISAALDVEAELTQTVLAAALISGTQNERMANRAIQAQAVLNSLTAISSRYLLRHTDGSINAQRGALNIEDLEARARRDLVEAKNLLLGRPPTAEAMMYIPALIDPITGA
jgi:hypothetical protein